MKVKSKIVLILAIFVLFSVTFCLNNVLAVGRVTQAWVTLVSGERALLFRTYTTPHKSTLESYTDTIKGAPNSYPDITNLKGNKYTYETYEGEITNSKWLYSTADIPDQYTYSIYKMMFHEEQMCDYSDSGDGLWAYNKPNEGFTLSNDMSTLGDAYANSSRITTMPKEKSGVKILHSVHKLPSTPVTGITEGTGVFVKDLDSDPAKINYIEYRYGIVRLNDNNIYVGDNIIYNDDLQELLKQLNGKDECYVSLVQMSQSKYRDDLYEVSETTYDFTKQYDKEEGYWSSAAHGKTDNALGSAFNLYDNLLKFPELSKRTVYVRHIAIGTGEVINTSIVENGIVENGERMKKIKQEDKFILENSNTLYSVGETTDYQEKYTAIPMTSQIEKRALESATLKELGFEDKECIGFNYAVATTLANAQNQISATVKDGYYLKGSEVQIMGKTTKDPDDVIVIEFYYSSEEKTPEVSVIETEPPKDVDGKVFVKTADDIEGICIDTKDKWQIASIPSGTNATVGIDGLPQYMAGAITLQQQQVDDTATYNVTINNGTDSMTVTYKLEYDITYYNIPNMLIYKYNGIKINDASGASSIFNWTNKVLTDNSLIKTPTVVLTGINNKNITNNSTGINTETNYYKIQFVSNKETEDVTNSKNGALNINLTSQQWNNIDTNKNGEISSIELANWLGLKAVIQVQNMNVKIDGTNLYDGNQIAETQVGFSDARIKSVEVSTLKPNISKTKYGNLLGTKITKNSYTNESYIKQSVLNGIRALSGTANYITTNIIGSATNIIDTVYYSDKNTAFSLKTGKTFTKDYEVNLDATTVQAKYEEVEPINIYTPITVKSTIEIDKNDIIDQTGVENATPLLQMNTTFKVKITNQKIEGVYNLGNTTKYSSGYYIKFDFDVHKVKVDGKTYNSGSKISAGTWIGFLAANNKGYVEVTAEAYSEDENEKFVSEEKSSYTVRGVAYNATELMKNTSKLYPTLKDLVNSSDAELVNNICSTPSYFAEETNQIMIINRMYDFRVTDIKDIEWKNTFRTTTGSIVNKHTGTLYYSGITKWDTSVSSSTNKIVNRPVSEIGRNPVRILPIGPYKNTDITKLKAPKLGYRLSFDLKVTGSYYTSTGSVKTDKEVNVQTSFYYISKDGKTFIEESKGGEGIYLFYKNSSGKYVRIDNAGGGYNLKFTPQDGYRYIEASDTKNLATTSVSLGNLRNMTLKYNMATPTDNKGAIIYYGEYKLPNSTIAVKVDKNGKYDIDKPLTNGYIGVVFNISANAGTITQNGVEKSVVLKYSQNTTDEPNTSQWDYEGFLGFTNYGSEVKAGELSLKLENGLWQITDSIYNKIKGTAILYDIDERAATDFE